jgi:hypothetical protein
MSSHCHICYVPEGLDIIKLVESRKDELIKLGLENEIENIIEDLKDIQINDFSRLRYLMNGVTSSEIFEALGLTICYDKILDPEISVFIITDGELGLLKELLERRNLL